MAKILMIEDDQVLVRMYKKILENHGYAVFTAQDGESGLKQAIEGSFDLILLDIRLPKIDGLTVMHKLRQNPKGKNIPIIILTNLDANDGFLKEVISDKPAFYLIKTNTSPDEVLEKINEVLTDHESK